jgi:RNA polymerase sigma-70 factor (ECF subfamily)
MLPVDEKRIVDGVLRKDPLAEREFYDAHRPRLQRLATCILGYRDGDVEDAVQETFLTAFQHLHEFEFKSTLYTWLYRICVFRCYERLRARKRQVASLDTEMEVYARKAAMAAAEGSTEADHKAYQDLLSRERDAVGGKCRELLRLRDVEGFPYARIAETIKVPIGTVMSRLSRCKEIFRERVAKAARKAGWIDG